MAKPDYEKWEDHKNVMEGLNLQIRTDEKERDEFLDEGLRKLGRMNAGIDVLKKQLRDEARRFSASFGRETPEAEATDVVDVNKNSLLQGPTPQTTKAGTETDADAEAETDMEEANDEREVTPASNNEEEDLFESTFGKAAGQQRQESPNLAPRRTATPESQTGSKRERPCRTPPFGSHKAYARISETHPTIIRSTDNDCWIEIRCSICQGNTSNSKHMKGRYLTGAYGLYRHVRKSHASEVVEPVSIAEVVKQGTYHQLSASEAEAILQGDNKSYIVPKIIAALPAADVMTKLIVDKRGSLPIATSDDVVQQSETTAKSAPMLGTKRTADEAAWDDSEIES